VFDLGPGIGIHKKMLAVAIRRVRDGKTEYVQRKFGIDGAVLTAGPVWHGIAFSATSVPSTANPGAARTQAGFRGCARLRVWEHIPIEE
jgi:hypothetical protein